MLIKKNKNILTLTLAVLLFVPQATLAKQNNNFEKGVIYALSACGAIVGGVASYKSLSSLFTKTDQQVLGRAEDNVHRISATYANMIHLHQQASIHSDYIDETVLNSMARERSGQHDITFYLDYLHKAIAILEADKKEISSRLHKAEKNGKYVECHAAMKLVAHKISHYIPQLTALYETLNTHCAYFTLYDAYTEHALRHGAIAQVFNYAYNSAQDFEYNLKTAVMAYDYRSNEKYPYMRYVELLKHDSSQLDHALSGCGYAYHDLIAASRALCDVLERAKQALIITKEYEQNIRDHQRAQREQKMLEEQRRQTEALQRQAQAQERQAREIARQNRLKEKEQEKSWSAYVSFGFEN